MPESIRDMDRVSAIQRSQRVRFPVYNPTFTTKTLSDQLKKTDFQKHPRLRIESEKSLILEDAKAQANGALAHVTLRTEMLRGKEIYRFQNLSHEIIARKATQNIRTISKVSQSDRSKIIRSAQALCEEGVSLRIYKYDIKSFYESIDIDALKTVLTERLFTNPSTVRSVSELLNQFRMQGVSGLPRGLAISASLAELYMDNFDRTLSRTPGIQFYARYVDDILLVADPSIAPKTINRIVLNELPEGLALNRSKSKAYRGKPPRRGNPRVTEIEFDYLGYRFSVESVNSRTRDRAVTLTMAPKKIKRIKSRIVSSIRQYLKDGQYQDLYDRIRILAGSYAFLDSKSGALKFGGLPNTHPLISNSESLLELDNFLIGMLSGRGGKILGPLRLSPLTKKQRASIKKISFVTGHRERARFSISNDRLIQLMKCWKYE